MNIATLPFDITPAHPTQLNGFLNRDALATGVLQPLMGCLWVMESESGWLGLLGLDLLGVDAALVEALQSTFASHPRFQDKACELLVWATHTHASVDYIPNNVHLGIYTNEVVEQREYRAQLCACFHDAMSSLSFVDATLAYEQSTISDLYHNRNDRNAPYTETAFGLYGFDAQGSMVAALLQIHCHPTILDATNTRYGSDFVGALQESFAAQHGVTPLIVLGASGDVSLRFDKQSNTLAECQRVGSALSAAFMRHPLHPLLSPPRFTLREEWIGTPRQTPTFASTTLALWQARLAQPLEAGIKRRLENELAVMELLNKHHALVEPFAFRIGRLDFGAFQMLTFPGEITTALAAELLERCHKPTMLVGYALDYVGYLVSCSDDASSYEAMVTRIEPKMLAELLAIT
ncbi:MAG: hypothetical protein ACRDBX_01950 [Erysipelotrichaceae bacterium]